MSGYCKYDIYSVNECITNNLILYVWQQAAPPNTGGTVRQHSQSRNIQNISWIFEFRYWSHRLILFNGILKILLYMQSWKPSEEFRPCADIFISFFVRVALKSPVIVRHSVCAYLRVYVSCKVNIYAHERCVCRRVRVMQYYFVCTFDR